MRRLQAAAALVLMLTACAAPPSPPSSDSGSDPGGVSVLDDARSVADDVETRQAELERQLQDPFSQP